MRDVINTNKELTGVFDWQSYLAFVGDDSTIPKGRTSASRHGKTAVASHNQDDYDWYKTRDFPEAMNLAMEGWSEAAERTRAIADPMFDKVSSLIAKHDMVYDVEGIGFDVARLLDGEPEHWVRWEEKIVEGPGSRIVRIALNQTVSAGVSADVIEAKGAVASALVELFEYSGTRCELWLVARYQDHGYHITSRVLVKAADQPLDLPRVMFALAHPSSFRRLSFSFVERCHEDLWQHFRHGYGRVEELDASEWDIYIPGSVYGQDEWTNPVKAKEFVIETLREQGVALREESEVGS